MTTAYENAVNFLWCCIEYSDDAELVQVDSIEDAAIQVEGYTGSFGDELPEVLRDPRSFLICWNAAVRKEIIRRFGGARPVEEADDRKLTLAVQVEFLPGPAKIYRAADGTIWFDYAGRWPAANK